MNFGDTNRCRLIGDYILGPKIGSGSFAVVWKARHRSLGLEVAVKEIDKKQINHKVNGNLFKEISILSNIRHPNIIRLHEAIECADKIYLILEYCNGGDLAAYINRHGRVSGAVARHFMRQLASGLQVLSENNLIHRDLKPQNLLLSTCEEPPMLKIGDFGFARYLTSQDLADTLCGSPLYMAPEIIQNQKYDAKADLWSVGAILFQLVTGKPPFDGNNQFQLFQNILTSTELRFPDGSLEKLHPDCVDLCRSLLRQKPAERLTFEAFFNHKFMDKQSLAVDIEHTSLPPEVKSLVEQFEHLTDHKLSFASEKRPQLDLPSSSNRIPVDGDLSNSFVLTGTKSGYMDQQRFSMSALKVTDSLESIEKDYVLVNAHFASTDTLAYSLEASLQDYRAPRDSNFVPNKIVRDRAVIFQTGEMATSLVAPQSSIEFGDVQASSSLNHSTRLQLLHQFIHALSELARDMLSAGMLLESFSVELIALAVWREAHSVCNSWIASTVEGNFPRVVSGNESTLDQEDPCLSLKLEEEIDFTKPASVSSWAQVGFIVAFDRAEKISNHLRDMDGSTEMPDAMELIFQAGLSAGRRGAEEERMRNKGSAEVWYSKAIILFSFIVGEAMNLPLKPPFLLPLADRQRIERYITNLKARLTHSRLPQRSHEHGLCSPSKYKGKDHVH